MTVLVTGANGAIGSACVDRFLADGHEVIAQDLRIDDGRDGVRVVLGSLLDQATHDELRSALAGTQLTAVVAAHGIAGGGSLTDCTPEFVQRVMSVNWETIPVLFDVVAPALQQTQGAFIAISSQAGLAGEADNSVYCAAKFAVNGWITARAASGSDISFHSICPGATNSALLRAAQREFAPALGLTPDEYYIERAKQISLGRYGEPNEIAAGAAYLAGHGIRPTILPITGGDTLL